MAAGRNSRSRVQDAVANQCVLVCVVPLPHAGPDFLLIGQYTAVDRR